MEFHNNRRHSVVGSAGRFDYSAHLGSHYFVPGSRILQVAQNFVAVDCIVVLADCIVGVADCIGVGVDCIGVAADWIGVVADCIGVEVGSSVGVGYSFPVVDC